MQNDKGFTLVEVVVAMAVVAIVASSIFQMFVTSSYVNKDAQVMDIANVTAVQQAENFKADPAAYSPGNRYSYYYYEGDGTPILPVYHDLVIIPAGASIMVKSDLPDPAVTPSNNAGYYPDFAGTLNLSTYINCDVRVKETYEIDVRTHDVDPFITLIDQVTAQSKIKDNILPIRVEFPTDGASRTINLTNDSDVEAEFYVYNTKNASDVVLDTVKGASSIAYIPAPNTNSINNRYQLNLTAYRMNNKVVGQKLLDYSTDKYINTH